MKTFLRKPVGQPDTQRIYKTVTIIVTSGTATERIYFEHLSALFGVEIRQTNQLVLPGVCRYVLHTEAVAPDQLVDIARKLWVQLSEQAGKSVRKVEYDDVWIICDTEKEHDDYRVKAADARQKCMNNNNSFGATIFKTAISDPSFELWLYFHDRDSNRVFESCKAVEKSLNESWKEKYPDYWRTHGKYEKNDLPKDLITKDKCATAIKNAQARRNYANQHKQNAYTEVDRLVSKFIIEDTMNSVRNNTAFLVDAREEVEWERGHLNYAHNFSRAMRELNQIPPGLTKDKPLYVYGKNHSDSRIGDTVFKLNACGFNASPFVFEYNSIPELVELGFEQMS